MTYNAQTVEEYIDQIPEKRKDTFNKLRSIIQESIPEGFEEIISYSFPSYVVPLSIYPKGYHCKKNEPLPFISIANQKNFIALYHMGIYAKPQILEWFEIEYAKQGIGKLDMGKSCIRFKNMKKIPYDLIRELVGKISVEDWINDYENSLG